MNRDGTIKWYRNETSESPVPMCLDATFKIEKSWIGKDGNVWLNMIYDWGIQNQYTVAKISDNGNTLEQVFSFDSYPTEIDPLSGTYFIMYKK